MSELLSALAEEAREYRVLEIIAVGAAIGYLLLAIRQSIWCWLCAAISTALYVYLFAAGRLYMEAVLNVFYFGMAIYGWYAWRFGGPDASGLTVTTWPVRRHVVAVLAIAVLASINGYLLERHTDAAFPYADAATTWAAFWTTFLVARKVLENWWYWLVIDAVSAVIFWLRGLELTSLLFVAYVLMIPFGYISWRRSLRLAAA